MLDYSRLPQSTDPRTGAVVYRYGSIKPSGFAAKLIDYGTGAEYSTPWMEAMHNGEKVYLAVFQYIPPGSYKVTSEAGSYFTGVKVMAGRTSYCS